jgi:hypothetical protein
MFNQRRKRYVNAAAPVQKTATIQQISSQFPPLAQLTPRSLAAVTDGRQNQIWQEWSTAFLDLALPRAL